MDHVPSGELSANSAWLQCAVLAHNLVRWTATLGQPGPMDRLTVARTVRVRLIIMPGRLVNRAGTYTCERRRAGRGPPGSPAGSSDCVPRGLFPSDHPHAAGRTATRPALTTPHPTPA